MMQYYCEPIGALFCHAMNIKTNGIVMTAVAMSTGWNALGSISSPARCRKGRGKTVKIQNATMMPMRWKFLFRRVVRLSLFTFFLSQLMHLVVVPDTLIGTIHEVQTLLSQK
jgi:hypothetical protein